MKRGVMAVLAAVLVLLGLGGTASANAARSLSARHVAPAAALPPSTGYWLVASDGGIFAFGDARFHGSTGGITLARPIVGMAATPDGKGYWLVASDGGIFAFGDARFHGSTGGITLARPIVGMAATPDGKGYWLVASDGGIFAFGDAHYYGSTGAVPLRKPIVGMAAMTTGKGYWLVASDGGIFAFGDAKFHGSTGGISLHRPVVAMTPSPDDLGYLLVASDGGIFAFGDAKFRGSTGGITLARPIVGMAGTPSAAGTISVTDIDGGRTLVDVSCPPGSTNWCMAVDGSGYAVNYSGGAWHSPTLVDPGTSCGGPATCGEFDGISCPAVGWCMAVSYLDGYSIYQSGKWSAIKFPPAAIGHSMWAVSCASTTFCDAEVDNFGDQAQWNSGVWTETAADQSLKTALGQGSGQVSCVAISTNHQCVYVDNGNRYSYYDNGKWAVNGGIVDAAAKAPKNEVSCYGAIEFLCVAVNYFAGDALIYGPTGSGGAYAWSSFGHVDAVSPLVDVSCDNRLYSGGLFGFCAAVDSGGHILYRAGAGWSSPLALDPYSNTTAISCGTSTFCVAVDFSGHAMVVNPPAPYS